MDDAKVVIRRRHVAGRQESLPGPCQIPHRRLREPEVVMGLGERRGDAERRLAVAARLLETSLAELQVAEVAECPARGRVELGRAREGGSRILDAPERVVDGAQRVLRARGARVEVDRALHVRKSGLGLAPIAPDPGHHFVRRSEFRRQRQGPGRPLLRRIEDAEADVLSRDRQMTFCRGHHAFRQQRGGQPPVAALDGDAGARHLRRTASLCESGVAGAAAEGRADQRDAGWHQ